MSRSVGVVIGRFQVPSLHGGHKAIINHVLEKEGEACVLVGVAGRIDGGLKNLLPFPAIQQMIRSEWPLPHNTGRLHIHPLPDIPGQDLQWSLQIDRFLDLLFPYHEVTLYSGRDSFKPSYSGKYRPVVDWYGYDGNVNGSKLRDDIVRGDPVDSPVFRAGIIYGLGNYLRTDE